MGENNTAPHCTMTIISHNFYQSSLCSSAAFSCQHHFRGVNFHLITLCIDQLFMSAAKHTRGGFCSLGWPDALATRDLYALLPPSSLLPWKKGIFLLTVIYDTLLSEANSTVHRTIYVELSPHRAAIRWK